MAQNGVEEPRLECRRYHRLRGGHTYLFSTPSTGTLMQEPTGRALIQVADNGENSIGIVTFLAVCISILIPTHQSYFPVQIIANFMRNVLMMRLTIIAFLTLHTYFCKMKYTQDQPVTLWSTRMAQSPFSTLPHFLPLPS